MQQILSKAQSKKDMFSAPTFYLNRIPFKPNELKADFLRFLKLFLLSKKGFYLSHTISLWALYREAQTYQNFSKGWPNQLCISSDFLKFCSLTDSLAQTLFRFLYLETLYWNAPKSLNIKPSLKGHILLYLLFCQCLSFL